MSSFLKSFLHFFVIMCLAGIPILGYTQGFLIAVSHFKNCILRFFVEAMDHTLHKCGFK